jgi:L-threonylcarbamoyladenylate synthase
MTAVVQQAVQTLHAGGLILYPTDTVWGIGCDATNAAAVAKIFALKRRTDRRSLIVLMIDSSMLRRHIVQLPAAASRAAEAATTPLTIIYPQARNLAENVPAADGSVAVRLVRHPFCEQLIRSFGQPLVSTSANISGQPAPVGFADIDGAIRCGCDFIVPPVYEGTPTRRPSSIIKIGLHEEIEIIRP